MSSRDVFNALMTYIDAPPGRVGNQSVHLRIVENEVAGSRVSHRQGERVGRRWRAFTGSVLVPAVVGAKEQAQNLFLICLHPIG
ncbi:hypothetical protein GCM10010347_63200 [Streptomyces cirratus]|uniref:Uncharacterized protein n=1 Tax=Streptomyces cirratus TaxID=68187 RepID=A0ABQ3F2H1_9ACTN|nr:hypothetical protein GCM10010347_63200 [Streptomyces cirratus]